MTNLTPGCPIACARDAPPLLASGRTSTARAMLETPPGLVGDALLASVATERARATADAEVARLGVEARDLSTRLARACRELADVEAALARRP